jgi:Ca2+-binding RTX toxin-like protein
MLPAGANGAVDGSVSIVKVQRGYDINVVGAGALVLSQRGKTLEVASGSPITLPAGCKARRQTGQWHTAACEVTFGQLVTVNLGDATKLGVNARDLIVDVRGSGGNDELNVKSLVAKVDGGAGHDTMAADGLYGAEVKGGDGDDDITVFVTQFQGMATTPQVDGGPGNDHITGSDRADRLSGGDGDDTIEAGDGNDIVTGNAGSDAIDGGRDADKIHGDVFPSDASVRPLPGHVTIYYAKIKGAWSVTQDSDKNDGSNADKVYWDIARENFYMDEVNGFEDVVKGPMTNR